MLLVHAIADVSVSGCAVHPNSACIDYFLLNFVFHP